MYALLRWRYISDLCDHFYLRNYVSGVLSGLKSLIGCAWPLVPLERLPSRPSHLRSSAQNFRGPFRPLIGECRACLSRHLCWASSFQGGSGIFAGGMIGISEILPEAVGARAWAAMLGATLGVTRGGTGRRTVVTLEATF